MNDATSKNVPNKTVEKQSKDVASQLIDDKIKKVDEKKVEDTITTQANTTIKSSKLKRITKWTKDILNKKIHIPVWITAIVLFILLLTVLYFFRKEATSNLSQITDWKTRFENFDKATSALQHIATFFALILGGIWAYYKFIKGRVLAPHLETKVTGKVILNGSEKFIIATVQVKNIGGSNVNIANKGTILGVYLYKPESKVEVDKLTGWVRKNAFHVLNDHYWIEPNETIEEPILIQIESNDKTIYRLRFRLNSGKNVWTTDTIVTSKIENQSQTSCDKTRTS